MTRAEDLIAGLEDRLPDLEALYRDLHEHPELSFQEKRTATVMAGRLAAAGFEVTTGVGGTGVVGVLRNGQGPTVLLRAPLGMFGQAPGMISDEIVAEAARRRPDIPIVTVPEANHYTLVLVDRFAAEVARLIEATDGDG